MKEGGTYLATDSRHRWRGQMTMRNNKYNVAFSRHCGLHQLYRKIDLSVSRCHKGGTGSKGGGGPVRLSDVDTRELAEFQN